ncbi:MAG: DNA-3-methyladenine glycosylase [Candidatus Azambacteria bacterium]|nr:DNA-3-methyladenine glycosylase [Candidatus Azambacteria bacterium]
MRVLTEKFFNRPVLVVARELLGKYLMRRQGKKIEKFMIIEVEAYSGLKDLASHASRGKTNRNAPMFGNAGHWYIYFTYGMHWMLNAVTGPENYPAAVLIRGVKTISGPGRLTNRLNIDKKYNGKDISFKTGLWISAPTESERASLKKAFLSGKIKVKRTSRIGVSYAGPIWSKKPWRFLIDNLA